MSAPQPPIVDFKPFVPAWDYEAAKELYRRIGFRVNWDSPEVCEIDTGAGFRFLLLPGGVPELAANTMLSLWVADVDAWYERLSGLRLDEEFPGTSVSPPQLEPWGWRICYLRCPDHLLWHIGQPVRPGLAEEQRALHSR
ncbi:MAG: glyoxalase [Proteobacteria bacterium]|nr:glyoxalase [Pseudomonadota bacterium]